MAGHNYVIEAGADAARAGAADWCQGCDKLRYRRDMRWLMDLYVCRECAPEAREMPVWDGQPSGLIPLVKSAPLSLIRALEPIEPLEPIEAL